MSKIDYQALREKAEKATCGVWSLEYGEGRSDGDDALIHREAAGYIPICRIEGAHPESGFDEDFQMEQQANAEFIAAANPATVLALLDELEAKDKLIAELGKQCAEWERKALSNFEECAAMAERIEEMSKQSCEARERDLFESWVMHSICISKSTLEGLRTETGYRNATLSGTDFNRMWEQWKSIRAAGIRIKGE
ncbi:ead/Ea22-like family protein [Salmonella enterica]|nr:ead/Ea22-like family protein [Salmonella enterica]